jgi:hypothetical protein
MDAARLVRCLRLVRPLSLAEASLYFLLAIAATWPLARVADRGLPLGTEPAATVPLLMTWTIWWNADRAAHAQADYWNAPIFHPTADTFAFSEPAWPTVIVAPILWISGNRVAAYNAFLLLALTINGWSTFRLLRALRLRWLASLLGGGLVELLPFVHHELGVLQLVPLCGIIWTLHALVRFGRRPTSGRAAVLAMAFASTYLLCAYYGLFLSILLPPAGLCLIGKRLLVGRTWPALALAAAMAALLVLPVTRAQMRVVRQHHLVRPDDWLIRLSARTQDYFVPPWPYFHRSAAANAEGSVTPFPLCPGVAKAALAAAGLVAGFRRRRYRAWTAGCLTILVASLLLSYGPSLHVLGWRPYELLMKVYPGFGQARNVFRFAVFVQIAVALLAALGLAGLQWLAWRWCRSGAKALGIAAIAVLGTVAAVELWPPQQRVFQVPSIDSQRDWIEWLRDRTAEDDPLACVPFPAGTSVEAYESTTQWMYWGTFHYRRMVNGYSGFFPESFLELKQAMQGFPDETSLRMLADRGVRYCVVQRAAVPPRVIRDNPALSERLIPVFRDERAGIDIYQLLRSPP